MTPPSAASVTSSSEAPTSSPVKLATILDWWLLGECCPSRARLLGEAGGGARVARAHTRAPSDEAAEVSRLGQRTLAARRGDLQRVALTELASSSVTRSHMPSVTPWGWSMNTRRQRPPSDLGEQHLDLRLAGREATFDVRLKRVHCPVDPGPYAKRAGGRPLSALLPAPARRHESCRSRIAASGAARNAVRRARHRVARVRGKAVIGALGCQRAGQRERLAGLTVASEQLHRATQAEQCVVVGGRAGGHRVELGGGAFIVLRMEKRPPERLADRGLVGLQIARLAQRHDRGLVVAVVEQLAAAPIEVVDAVHRFSL